MKTTLSRSACELITADAAPRAPTELRIFPFGSIETTKGRFNFTKKSAALVQAQWKRLGRDVGFDYEHGLFDKTTPGRDRDAAGWGKIEVRADGLWITAIRWTPDAARKVATRAFRYLSPAFRAEPKTGEILSLENVAITNFPATLQATPMVLTSRPHLLGMDETQDKKHAMLAKGLLRGCSALLSAAQAAAESDNPELKKMGADLAGMIPERVTALQAAFPHMEPDGDEGEPDGDEGAKKLAAAVRKLTGKDGDEAIGVLYALRSQAGQATRTADDSAQRKALVAELVKTGRIELAERADYEDLTLPALQAAKARLAPGKHGPKGGADAQGTVQLDGKPPENAATNTPEADALLNQIRIG